jgi:hypothetical protein
MNIPSHYSEPVSSSIIADHKIINNRIFPAESSNKEEFLTPDLLRLAGIQYSTPDDGYETNSSPILHSNCDSRFFPISINRHKVYSNDISKQVSHSFSYNIGRKYEFYLYFFSH